ncbi:hypothetical protein P6N53_14305 [Desulforamulus aquiferis]|uniref:LppX_LprAFG lipoprotein n=2 Tax=Desulforamulus aquiferis TaxID=1397668 RepID=A0AAW7ZGD7_9FIRM|nr:hypothetical protein [Desulforamulus aquiferis]
MLNRHRIGPIAVVLGVLIFVLVLGGMFFSSRSQIDAQKTFDTALYNTFASKSFRFTVESKLLGENEFYSKVEGERVMPDKVHIKGTILKTPVEFTQIQNNTYMRDPFSGKWITLNDVRMSQAELFVTELNPLSNFNFKDIPELSYRGEEQINGETLLAYELRPNVENIFLEEQFNDFFYKVWVDPKGKTIRQATIRANKTLGDVNGLEIFIKMWDYNRNLKIDIPQ